MSARAGIGFDVHPFAEGRRLVLGGVEIAHPLGLAGHSDADVLCHAVMDALLGAAAEGDIGQHFPSGDPRWKDARSLDLLAAVKRLVLGKGLTIVHVDATILAEAPRVAPHAVAMRRNIAEVLDLSVERVSVKATTLERLGAIGRREGIAAMAVATLEEDGKAP
jgi:2-C-methyl-D-erythritol 2,4-cyclodiphosphate synthase